MEMPGSLVISSGGSMDGADEEEEGGKYGTWLPVTENNSFLSFSVR